MWLGLYFADSFILCAHTLPVLRCWLRVAELASCASGIFTTHEIGLHLGTRRSQQAGRYLGGVLVRIPPPRTLIRIARSLASLFLETLAWLEGHGSQGAAAGVTRYCPVFVKTGAACPTPDPDPPPPSSNFFCPQRWSKRVHKR